MLQCVQIFSNHKKWPKMPVFVVSPSGGSGDKTTLIPSSPLHSLSTPPAPKHLQVTVLFTSMQLLDESVFLQNVRLERQQSIQKSHLKELRDFADEFSLRLSSQNRQSAENSVNSQQSSSNVSNVSMGMVSL